jgi:hypothetical protein
MSVRNHQEMDKEGQGKGKKIISYKSRPGLAITVCGVDGAGIEAGAVKVRQTERSVAQESRNFNINFTFWLLLLLFV